MKTPDAVTVTGIGMVTAAGIGADATWKAVCAGRPTARRIPELAGPAVDFGCPVPGFDPLDHLDVDVVRRTDRCTQLTLVAAREALAVAGLTVDGATGARVGVVIGTAFGGIGTVETEVTKLVKGRNVSPLTIPRYGPNMIAGQLSLHTGATGPSLAVSTACASGTTALGVGRDLLLSGRCDVVLAGAADAPLNRITTAAFARMDALSKRPDAETASRPFDEERDGFVLAEGAAVLVLERRPDAEARGAPPLAVLAGYGASADAHHFTSPDPSGTGLERAVREALADADAALADVDHVNAHATSTPLGDAAEARLLARLLGSRPVVTAAKGSLGHAMGAAGAVEAALTVLAINRRCVPPVANLRRPDPSWELDLVTTTSRAHSTGLALSVSCGFGGQNAVLAFTPA